MYCDTCGKRQVPWHRFECPTCQGEGGWMEYVIDGCAGPWTPCPVCEGEGDVGWKTVFGIWFWNTMPEGFVEWYGDWMYRRES